MDIYQPPDYRAFRQRLVRRRRQRHLATTAFFTAAAIVGAAVVGYATRTTPTPAPATVTFPTATPANGLPDDATARRKIDADLAAGRPVPPFVRLYYGYPITADELNELVREGKIALLANGRGHYENGQPVVDSITTPTPATPTPRAGQA